MVAVKMLQKSCCSESMLLKFCRVHAAHAAGMKPYTVSAACYCKYCISATLSQEEEEQQQLQFPVDWLLEAGKNIQLKVCSKAKRKKSLQEPFEKFTVPIRCLRKIRAIKNDVYIFLSTYQQNKSSCMKQIYDFIRQYLLVCLILQCTIW